MTRLKTAFVALLACSAAVLSLRAGGASIVGSQLNGNLLSDFSGAGTLEIDTAFVGTGPIVLTVRPDAPSISFNNLVTFLFAGGAAGYRLGLAGGATWGLVGSIDPITTATSFVVASTGTDVAIWFNPHELIEVDLGNVGFGGTNWSIDTRGVANTFMLTLQPVPEPASLSLFAVGLVAATVVARKRRRPR